VRVSNDLKKTIAESDIVILAVPSAFLKSALGKITADDFKGKIVFSAIKGIIPEDLLIVGDFMQKNSRRCSPSVLSSAAEHDFSWWRG
jgi:glycerol-3-phosphate dehydrogenase (NAD(P)+)